MNKQGKAHPLMTPKRPTKARDISTPVPMPTLMPVSVAASSELAPAPTPEAVTTAAVEPKVAPTSETAGMPVSAASVEGAAAVAAAAAVASIVAASTDSISATTGVSSDVAAASATPSEATATPSEAVALDPSERVRAMKNPLKGGQATSKATDEPIENTKARSELLGVYAMNKQGKAHPLMTPTRRTGPKK
jgi:hypothetical protein